jgi:hypothetical protein
MTSALRVLAAFVGAVATYYFVFWFGGTLLIPARLFPWLGYVVAAVVSILVARYVWVHTASPQTTLARSVLLWALVTGAVAFSAGFFGPVLLTPHANQGPLLGLFITGPLGFILGGIGGAIYWLLRRGRGSCGGAA